MFFGFCMLLVFGVGLFLGFTGKTYLHKHFCPAQKSLLAEKVGLSSLPFPCCPKTSLCTLRTNENVPASTKRSSLL